MAGTGLAVKQLAHKADCNARTIRNFLNGRSVRDETAHAICKAAGIDPAVGFVSRNAPGKSADDLHGSYSKEMVQNYLGFFYAYRRTFSDPTIFLRSLYAFNWDPVRKCMRFKESQNYQSARLRRRVNYDQEGDVFISSSITLVHLLTQTSGALRLITLTRLHPEERIMRGVVLTQAEWPDHFQPAVSPIYFRKIDGDHEEVELARKVGPVERGDADYDDIGRGLEYTLADVVKFAK